MSNNLVGLPKNCEELLDFVTADFGILFCIAHEERHLIHFNQGLHAESVGPKL